MKQDIKKLIKSVIILSSAFILIDALVGYVGEKALKMLPDFGGEICQTNYRLNRVESDIIIVGSSRARNHFCTSILADSVNAYLGTNYSFYNAGIAGHFVNSNICSIESMLNRYKPKLIIFETNIDGFKKHNWEKQLHQYEPFYKSNSIVKKYIDKVGWKEIIKVKINMYRFNSKTINIIGSLMRHNKPDDGYSPLYKTMKITESKKEKTDSSNKINDFSIDSFNEMLTICKDLNINILITSSPRYKPSGNNELIHEICDKQNTPYIELYNTDYFNNKPELFYNKSHLNNNGAIIYTKMFFEELKPYLKGL